MFVVDQAAIFSATCNQMNAPCEQLSSNKVPNCAWSIRQDVDQDLRCLRKTFTCSCHIALLSRGQFLESAHSRIYVLFFFFLGGGEVLRIEGSLKKSAKGPLTCLCNGEKGFALVKSPYLQCFLALGGHVICGHCFYYLATVQEFSSRLLPFWVMRYRIIDH